MKNLGKEISFNIPTSLSQNVAEYIEKQIIEGTLEPGFRLIPEELAKLLNISKSPVREALLSLKKDGFVNFISRIGFFVADIDLKDIEEIYPIRASLNALMVETIIEKGYDSDFIPTLEKILNEMDQVVQCEDIKEYFYLNVALYDYMLSRC